MAARLSLEQIAALAVVGGLTSPTAVATACAISGWNGSPDSGESGGDPAILGDVGIQTGKWGPSVGLWQVRSLKAELNTGGTRDASKLTDPTYNARSMFEISSGGTNWQPWSVYTSGKYRANMEAATDYVEGAVGSSGGGISAGQTDYEPSSSWRDRIVNAVGGQFVGDGSLSVVGDGLGAIGDVAGGLGDLGSIAARLAGLLSDPSWWRRVGLLLAGLVLIAFGAGLLGRDLLTKQVGPLAKAAAA